MIVVSLGTSLKTIMDDSTGRAVDECFTVKKPPISFTYQNVGIIISAAGVEDGGGDSMLRKVFFILSALVIYKDFLPHFVVITKIMHV